MITRSIVLAALLSISTASSIHAGEAAAPAGDQAALPLRDALIAYGFVSGDQLQLHAFALSEAELEAVLIGISAAARGERPPVSLADVWPAVRQFVEERPAEVAERRAAEGRAEAEAFFAEIDQAPGVRKTESGLRYEILEEGTGSKPDLGDSVIAHYTGRFIDGEVFDSSVERGEPAQFPLSGVIAGWQEGLQLISEGGSIRLYIPGDLAYGDTGRDPIPPAKTLIFDVELIEVLSEAGPPAPAEAR